MTPGKIFFANDRTSIITAVKNPLGFFVLVVLVVEGILGLVTGAALSGSDRSVALYGMFIVIGVLIALVALLAVFRPEVVGGVRKDNKLEELLKQSRSTAERTRAENDELRNGLHRVEEQNHALRLENERLSERLSRIESVTSRIWAILLARGSASLSEIMGGLDIHFHGPAYDEVLGILGSLAEEGKIRRDESKGGEYYMLTSR